MCKRNKNENGSALNTMIAWSITYTTYMYVTEYKRNCVRMRSCVQFPVNIHQYVLKLKIVQQEP